MKRGTLRTTVLPAFAGLAFLIFFFSPLHAEVITNSTVTVNPPQIEVSTSPAAAVSTGTAEVDKIVSEIKGTGKVLLDKVEVDDSGTKLMVMIHTSQQVESFIFERRDPPSLFVQFMGTTVYAGGEPVQVVGIDPLAEIRYGYSQFQDAAVSAQEKGKKFPLDYLELRLKRPVFFQVQKEGWMIVIGLDRTTEKVEIPELDFRIDVAKYEGAAKLPENPVVNNFVEVSQNNSRLLAVAREEVELAKSRVNEARRSLLPSLTARVSATRGTEANAFDQADFQGFESAAFKRDEYGVQLAHPLYHSGRLYRAYKQAKINHQMAQENLRKQSQDLTFEVKKAYFTLHKNQSVLRVRRELVAQGEVIKELSKKKFDLDLASKAEVLSVKAQADQASYQMTGDEQDVQLARLVLISLLNQATTVPDPVPGALSFARLSFNVESIIAWAQEHRPDVRIARLNTELAYNNWKAAKGDTGFKLDASGFLGKSGATFRDNEEDFKMRTAWNVGLRASTTFGGNTFRANYAREHTAPDLGQVFFTNTEERSLEMSLLDAMPANSASRQAELQYEKAKAEMVEAARKAEYEIRESYYNLEKSARQLEAIREDMEFRHKDLDITREKIRLGLSELSQLMTAEVAYAEAQIKEQESLSAYNTALASLDRVAGAEVVKE